MRVTRARILWTLPLAAAALAVGCGGSGAGLSAGTCQTIAVSSPNGGESWGITTSREIAWTSDIVRDVRVELSRDSGATWEELAASTPAAAGSCSWTATGPASTECLVRVSDAADGRPSDVSDATFEIALYELAVVSPNGGEVWHYQGDDREITWNASGVGGNVEILYTADGSTWNPVATVPAADGSYTWTVPDEDSSTCLVRVQEEGGAGLSDESDAPFTIAPAGITVTAPNGGEEWGVGSSVEITWTSAGLASVHIELSRDDGSSWEDIVASVPAAAGTHTWTVTGPVSALCLVRVSDAADGAPADASDATFSIAVHEITVTSPNGGEVWAGGSSENITWTSSGVADVRIELSRDDGLSWEEIVASTPAAAGSYGWTVTGPASAECLVRVSDASDGSPVDASDAAFAIPGLAVTSPNGGEVWYYQGDDRDITWNAVGVSGNVEIHYSTDGGLTYPNLVATVPAADGSHSWTIPNENSSTCLVRVREEGGAGLSDDSDAPFTIAPASVTVTNPDGGETWNAGSSHNITWTSAGVANVRIELSRDDGGTWEDIILSAAAAAGSYNWTVTGPESTLCLVRVSDAADGLPADVSGATFAIEISAVTGVLYVDADAAGANDGTSWADAYPDLQLALANIGTSTQIWVAEGTYKPTSGADRNATFTLPAGVPLYGGFAGGESALDARDWAANPTVLSGEIGDGGVTTDNSIHVVTAVADSTLDGFRVAGGYNDAGGGGGLYVYRLGPVTVRNCTFLDNSATSGGAILFDSRLSAWSLTIDRCVFLGNTTLLSGASNGGAIWLNYQIANVTITNCVFSGNSADYGGAIGITRGDAFAPGLVVNCTFSGDTAAVTGHAVSLGAGGTDPCGVKMRNCIIWGADSNLVHAKNTTSIITLSNCCVQNYPDSFYLRHGSYVVDEGGIITGDPLFLDADGADDTVGTLDDDVRLTAGSSSCIDAGTSTDAPPDDIEGTSRPQGSDYDIGAYEQ